MFHPFATSVLEFSVSAKEISAKEGKFSVSAKERKFSVSAKVNLEWGNN